MSLLSDGRSWSLIKSKWGFMYKFHVQMLVELHDVVSLLKSNRVPN